MILRLRLLPRIGVLRQRRHKLARQEREDLSVAEARPSSEAHRIIRRPHAGS